jgi:hypothetical protein
VDLLTAHYRQTAEVILQDKQIFSELHEGEDAAS